MNDHAAGASPVDRTVRPAAEARWYCLDRDGVAMLCKDEADARAQVIENDDCWPGRAPHRAVLLGDVAALEAENAALKHDLQYARDGLTKGRTRMREDNERLRDALQWIDGATAANPGLTDAELGRAMAAIGKKARDALGA